MVLKYCQLYKIKGLNIIININTFYFEKNSNYVIIVLGEDYVRN